jgi:hypothetical protein
VQHNTINRYGTTVQQEHNSVVSAIRECRPAQSVKRGAGVKTRRLNEFPLSVALSSTSPRVKFSLLDQPPVLSASVSSPLSQWPPAPCVLVKFALPRSAVFTAHTPSCFGASPAHAARHGSGLMGWPPARPLRPRSTRTAALTGLATVPQATGTGFQESSTF